VGSSSQTELSDSTGDHRSSAAVAVRRIFLGREGLGAGWSALLFIAIYGAMDAAVHAALGHFVSLDAKGPIPLTLALLQECCGVGIVLVATGIMARIEKCRILSFGYTGDHKLIRLLSGAMWGFLCLSVLTGVLWKAGFLVFDGLSLRGLTALEYAFAWGLVFLVVGVLEESLLRGYLQHTLTRGLGFWWAALLLSVAFALGHLSNQGESLLGLLEVGAGGLVFCLSLWYTKSLFWAVGFHAGWDWAQSYIYGTPDSGLIMKQHLLASHPSGNPLWSGGMTGPEGSLLLLPLLLMIATGMWVWWGAKKRSTR
jgi:membrane protease YdiL (CAAX protease family)